MDKEYLGKLMLVENDHLKDTQKMIDCAIMFKHKGHTEAMNFFASQAKHRMTMYDELHRKTQSMLATMPKAEENSKECMCWNILEQQTKSWVDKMKLQIGEW